MTDLVLTGLFRYPVKSLGGNALPSLDVGRRGPAFDRAWMLVDDAGRFLTQRQLPRMALISADLDPVGALMLSAPGLASIRVAVAAQPRIDVRVWNDTVSAVWADPAADAWLEGFLGHRCRLVFLPPETVRPVDPAYAAPSDEVGFADGFPFLLISQASLDELNRLLETPVTMTRFRPNLVVGGCGPHAEDGWRRLRIGDLTFRVVKPCSRCIIPTIDPQTAERGNEPLRTLSSYRRQGKQILFGQNLVHEGAGRLEVGAAVEVLE
jgi:uncharacterized protein YcbX